LDPDLQCSQAGEAKGASYERGANYFGIGIKICFYNPKQNVVTFIQMGEGREKMVRDKYTNLGYQSICQSQTTTTTTTTTRTASTTTAPETSTVEPASSSIFEEDWKEDWEEDDW
jgi:hypothetical protein